MSVPSEQDVQVGKQASNCVEGGEDGEREQTAGPLLQQCKRRSEHCAATLRGFNAGAALSLTQEAVVDAATLTQKIGSSLRDAHHYPGFRRIGDRQALAPERG